MPDSDRDPNTSQLYSKLKNLSFSNLSTYYLNGYFVGVVINLIIINVPFVDIYLKYFKIFSK